jgi:hypothetical protein
VAPASVIFWNTAAVARDVVATISSTRGRANTQSFRIDARSAYTLGAVNFPGRHFFGVSAAVAGGGVTGIVSGVGDDSANVPCSASVPKSTRRWTSRC